MATQGPHHATAMNPMALSEWFRRRTSRAPEAPALSYNDETWSFRETLDRIEALAAVLASKGVEKTTRVGYLGFNNPVGLLAMFAAAHLGAIFVPLNFRLSSRELKQCIDDAGIHTLIVDQHHQGVIEEVRTKLGCNSYIGADSAKFPGWTPLADLLREAPPVPPAVDGRPEDVACLYFTSGTTGRAKAAMLTNDNLWVNNLNWFLASDYTSKDVGLNIAPFFHVAGILVTAMPTLMAGGHVVLLPHFDPAKLLQVVEKYRVTVTMMVPAMMLALSQHELFAKSDLSSMRLIVAGGAPVPVPLLRQFNERNIPVSQCYGMTEATSAVTFLETDRAISKLGSCGRAGMLNEVRLVDFNGSEITEPHVRGEICMRGGNVIKGYWNLPEVSRQSFDAEGWFRSGDVGYFDEEGFFYICDRVKDMIISGGENVYPAEVESALYEHPAIAEVAVIGAPDERWGETVVAVAALRPNASLTLDELQAFCGSRLARYKTPRYLHIVDALPRNGNGKVIKTELRQQFGSAAAAQANPTA